MYTRGKKEVATCERMYKRLYHVGARGSVRATLLNANSFFQQKFLIFRGPTRRLEAWGTLA